MNIATNIKAINWHDIFTNFTGYTFLSGAMDIFLITIFLIALFSGLKRGFFKTVWSLLGWILIFFAAYMLSPKIGHLLMTTDIFQATITNNLENQFIYQSIIGQKVITSTAETIAFIILVVILGLIAKILLWLLDSIFSGSPVGFVNRIAGMVLGALIGIVLVGVIGSSISAVSAILPSEASKAIYEASTHSKVIYLINNLTIEFRRL